MHEVELGAPAAGSSSLGMQGSGRGAFAAYMIAAVALLGQRRGQAQQKGKHHLFLEHQKVSHVMA